ncbi:hypothetical protein [Flavobacterium sp. LHD-85]|uniref:hypothetical protein n=1 Tax=Flavobacterium sp. LHD-85 TaxID=3071410 RepID=UPI0027E0C292|nr:hypothetical protein [Flavobacterium sp. LHD-85]MDQ6532158.1 hypothetical protein [Flavobacterium sp. LHD-85]
MQNIIDRTNKFYLLISRHLLSKKEYEVLEKLLIEKMSLEQAAQLHGVTPEYIGELYEKVCIKAKAAAELFSEIGHHDKKPQKLKHELNPSPAQIKRDKMEKDRQKLLFNSRFHFSGRMNSIFEALDILTIGELADIPLQDFLCLRGFKTKCKEELIAFIESENIEYLFKGFALWKKQPIEQLK